MKKKDILEYIAEVEYINVEDGSDNPEKTAKEIKDKVGDKAEVTYTDEEGSEVEVQEESVLDLNLLENEIYEEIKNEELGKMSKKEIMEMISMSKIDEDCIGYHFHGEEGEPSAEDVEVTVKKIEEEEEEEMDVAVADDDVKTKPKTKPSTAPAKTPKRQSPFNPPKQKPAPAKALSEDELTESIISITKNFINV